MVRRKKEKGDKGERGGLRYQDVAVTQQDQKVTADINKISQYLPYLLPDKLTSSNKHVVISCTWEEEDPEMILFSSIPQCIIYHQIKTKDEYNSSLSQI